MNDKRRLTLWLPEETLARLEALAAQECRSVPKQAIRLLLPALDAAAPPCQPREEVTANQ